MRTTLNIDDRLMRQVKKEAAERGETVTSLVEAALRDALTRRHAAENTPFRLQWITARGQLKPGVDITDRDSLYERMDERS